MRKYLTDTTAYISKLQEYLQILSIFDLTLVLYWFFRSHSWCSAEISEVIMWHIHHVTDDVKDMWWWLILDLIGPYILKTLTISVGIINFRKIRNKIDNLLWIYCIFRDINFYAIIVEKQLIKHDILTRCLTCNFHHMSQYNSFPLVCRGLTEHRREHPVYYTGWPVSLLFANV